LLFVVQEGLAHLCLVGSSTTLVRAKVEANLPRKRGPAVAGYDKAFDKFMDQVGH
jgi:protein pelota